MEGDGALGDDRRTGNGTGRRIDAARDVERHDGCSMLRDARDRRTDLRTRDTLCPGAEQGVDDDVGTGEIGPSGNAEPIGHSQHRRRIPAHAIVGRDQHDPDIQAAVAEVARDHEAVAAVVAGTADDGDPAGIGIAHEEHGGCGCTRRLHQRGTREPGLGDGPAVELSQVFGPPQRLHGS